MPGSRITYHDVSSDPAAEARAVQAPEFRDALLQLGFARAGLLEVRVAGGPRPETLRQYMADPDADLLIQVLREGAVVEVLASPDGRAFATAERFLRGPVICMHTILEDGTVVETVTRPVRTPEPASLTLTTTGLAGAVTGLLMRVTMGKPPAWPHTDQPREGYRMELADTRDASALWQQHRQRVDEIASARDTGVPRHDTPAVYLCASLRRNRIDESHARQERYFSLGALVASLAIAMPIAFYTLRLAAALGAFGASQSTMWTILLPLLLMLAVVLLMLAVVVLALFAIGIARRTILPRLPGPPQQPVTELLQAVHAEYGI